MAAFVRWRLQPTTYDQASNSMYTLHQNVMLCFDLSLQPRYSEMRSPHCSRALSSHWWGSLALCGGSSLTATVVNGRNVAPKMSLYLPPSTMRLCRPQTRGHVQFAHCCGATPAIGHVQASTWRSIDACMLASTTALTPFNNVWLQLNPLAMFAIHVFRGPLVRLIAALPAP